jgi:hypothetical protein
LAKKSSPGRGSSIEAIAAKARKPPQTGKRSVVPDALVDAVPAEPEKSKKSGTAITKCIPRLAAPLVAIAVACWLYCSSGQRCGEVKSRVRLNLDTTV